MLTTEHAQTARDFLAAADIELADGELVQGSEKLWGAAAHAVIAVAQQRGWQHRSHRSMKNAVTRIAQEQGSDEMLAGFLAAEKFHRNYYHDDMEDYERDADRPIVHRFVHRMLALIE